METRRSFIGKGSAALLAGAFGAAPWRTAEALELPDDPTAEELDELRRKWSFWFDPPKGYVFRRESRLVKAYEYSDCRAELYLQRNGPEDWHWQRVLKVFPKTIEKPLPAVGIPFYYVEPKGRDYWPRFRDTALAHRPPAWALEAGYNFLDRKLNGKWGNKPWL